MQNLPLIGLLALLTACTTPDGGSDSNEPPATSPAAGKITLTQEQFSTSAMELGKMREASFGNSVRANGIIDVPAEGRAEISSYYGGYVRDLNLLTGQQVKRGELLFILESPEYVQMQQDYLEAKSQLSYLQSDFERQQTLSRENIASQKNFLRAESEYNVTLARFEGLKKKLILLNLDPESITAENLRANIPVYAPISGYITAINAVNGSYLSPADVAASLINTEHIHLDLNIFEHHIATIKEGQPIRFRLPNDPEMVYEATVFMIGRAIQEQGRIIKVHAQLKDEKQTARFTPGMYVEAEIFSSNGLSPALPADAVVELSGQYFVLAKKESGNDGLVFERKEVNPGATADGLTEILNAGDFGENDEFLTKGAFNLIQ